MARCKGWRDWRCVKYWGMAVLSCWLCVLGTLALPLALPLVLPAIAQQSLNTQDPAQLPSSLLNAMGDRQDHPRFMTTGITPQLETNTLTRIALGLIAGEDKATPESLLNQGQIHYQEGRFAEAAALWQRVAQGQSSDAHPTPDQLRALRYLGIVYQDLGRWREAERAIAQALTQLKTQPEPFLLAQTLLTQGSLQLNQGNAEAAIATWTQAADLYRSLQDPSGILLSQLNQVEALQSLGFYQRSRDLISQIRTSLDRTPDPALKAQSLLSLGRILRAIGDRPEAEQVLDESLALAEANRDADAMARTLIQLGDLATDPPIALARYDQAEAKALRPSLRLEAALRRLRLAVTSGAQPPAAITALIDQLRPQIQTLPASRWGLYTQVNFAETLRLSALESALKSPLGSSLGADRANNSRLALAEQILRPALAQANALADPRVQTYALGQLGAIAEAQSRWSDALRLTRQAHNLAQSIQAEDIAVSWLWQEGRILKAQGQTDTAIAPYSQAIEHLQNLRQDLVAMNPDVQFSFRDQVEPIYRELVQLLLNGVDQLPPAQRQERLERSRQTLETLQLAQLQNFLRQACETYTPQALDTLDPQAALIYSISLGDRLEVILSLPNQPLRHYSTAFTPLALETLVRQLRQSLNPAFPPEEGHPAAQRLYDALVRPAEPDLQQAQITTLVFVLDDLLRGVPMAILHDGDRYLIERYSLALTPGLQLFAGKSLATPSPALLVGGLSEARHGFMELPGVREEVQRIQTLGKTEILLNQSFTQAKLSQTLEQVSAPIVHLATHGQFSSNLQDTFLLTWDGPFTVPALGRGLDRRPRRSPVELLVLSACQTAKGDDRATLGLAGLAVRSGARSTLATLWSVQDRSTATFMAEFYQQLLGQGRSRSEALRQTQLQFLHATAPPTSFPLDSPPASSVSPAATRPTNRSSTRSATQPTALAASYRHPYYWAPFVLIGSWE